MSSTQPDDEFFGPFGRPADIPSAYPEIAAAVRFALTGDPNSTTPTGPIIDYPARIARRDLFRGNPCTGTAADGFADTMSAEDREYFNEAAGYLVALSLLNTPAAASYARTLVKVKIGPVEESVQDGVVIDTARKWLETEYNKALGSIACVRDGRIAAAEAGGGFGLRLAGRRRALEANCGCRTGSPLYNGNRGGY